MTQMLYTKRRNFHIEAIESELMQLKRELHCVLGVRINRANLESETAVAAEFDSGSDDGSEITEDVSRGEYPEMLDRRIQREADTTLEGLKQKRDVLMKQVECIEYDINRGEFNPEWTVKIIETLEMSRELKKLTNQSVGNDRGKAFSKILEKDDIRIINLSFECDTLCKYMQPHADPQTATKEQIHILVILHEFTNQYDELSRGHQHTNKPLQDYPECLRKMHDKQYTIDKIKQTLPPLNKILGKINTVVPYLKEALPKQWDVYIQAFQSSKEIEMKTHNELEKWISTFNTDIISIQKLIDNQKYEAWFKKSQPTRRIIQKICADAVQGAQADSRNSECFKQPRSAPAGSDQRAYEDENMISRLFEEISKNIERYEGFNRLRLYSSLTSLLDSKLPSTDCYTSLQKLIKQGTLKLWFELSEMKKLTSELYSDVATYACADTEDIARDYIQRRYPDEKETRRIEIILEREIEKSRLMNRYGDRKTVQQNTGHFDYESYMSTELDDILRELNRNNINPRPITEETSKKFQDALISLLIYKCTPKADHSALYATYLIKQKDIHTYEEVVSVLSQQVR